MHAWLAPALLLAATATAGEDLAVPQCDDAIISEGLAEMGVIDCVTIVKSCLKAGTCAAAGVTEHALCQCYRKVQLPLRNRPVSAYHCRATAKAPYTIWQEWKHCVKSGRPKVEL